jgi:serine/threonine protein kinase
VTAASEETNNAVLWKTGQLLADRYRVRECVREPGTCQLFRVQDVFRGNYHLLMRPSPPVHQREGWREWFAELCRNALCVPPHPNVLACERVVEEGDVPFLIMEDVRGSGWDAAIRERRFTDLSQMLDVALQTAWGLDWLHQHHQIHYNVKPANVLLCDSGLAKVWKYGEPDAKTRAYASPEQLAGGRPVTKATDVWSWAVSVLDMFTGRVAWRLGTEAPLALRRYMQNGPAEPGIPLMPGGVVRLLATCFKTDPDTRTIGMDQIAAALDQMLRQPAAAPTSPAQTPAAKGAQPSSAAQVSSAEETLADEALTPEQQAPTGSGARQPPAEPPPAASKHFHQRDG